VNLTSHCIYCISR